MIHAVILAGGEGSRFGLTQPKQFLKIGGKTVFEHTIDAFEINPYIDDIIVVINPTFKFLAEDIIFKNSYKKVTKLLNGGKTRKESSYIGIASIDNDEDYVLIHDAVRPFVSQRIIEHIVQALSLYDAVDTAIMTDDTIIKIDDDSYITEVPLRKFLRRGQTPQAFKVGLIKKAHILSSKSQGEEFTDDCGLIRKYNLAPVYVLEGERFNIKITYPEDVYLADKIFQIKSQSLESNEEELASKIKDKTITIFGASRGIGRAIFDLASSLGAYAFGYSRSNGVDVRDYSLIERSLKDVLEKTGNIDFIIDTAGYLKTGLLISREAADIEKEIQTNLIGSINIVKAACSMANKNKLSVLLFASSSYTRGRAFYSVYSATKAAIVNFMQGMADELLEKGILINALNPERTATRMRFENFGLEPPESLLSPETVARAALKVVSSNLTGQVIDVRRKTNDEAL